MPGPDDARSPGAELEPLAGGEVEARVALVGLRGQDRVVAQPRDRKLDHARSAAEPSMRVRDEVAGEAPHVALRQPGADQHAVAPVSSRSSIGAPSA